MFLTIYWLVAAAPAARGQSLAKVDPRALAMGGGYVAAADGWAALQWNPAGLWVGGRREVALTFGSVPLEGGPWVESLRARRGLPSDIAPSAAAQTLAADDAGLAGERVFGAYVAAARWGGGFQQATYMDEVSVFRNGRVEIDSASLRTREFLVSGAYPLALGRLVIGGTAKLVQTQTRVQTIFLEDLEASELTAGGLLEAARSGRDATADTVFAVDVGVLIIPSAKFRIGAVVKNLNAPSLDSAPEAIGRLPRQIRVGGLVLPHPKVRLTLDFDVDHDTLFDGGRERRELGGGVEWAGEAVAVRGGLLFDLAAIENRALYTFGLGISGQTFRADMAGSWAPDRDGFGWIGALVGAW